MEQESFYGETLTGEEPLAQFEMEKLHPNGDDQKLVIKQICLGAEAKEGEFNVVQVEVRTNHKETLKVPIAVLKAGETRSLRPNVEFLNTSVTFKLIQGTGPVHLYGQNWYGQIAMEESYEPGWGPNEEEEYDDEEYEEALPPPPQTNGKNKRK